MTQVAKSPWQSRSKTNPTVRLLKFLGIAFKNRKGFWLANEADKDFLYSDLCLRAKKVLRELHPDNGGNALTFAEFSREVDRVKKAFRNHGVRFPGDALNRMRDQEHAHKRMREKQKLGAQAYRKTHRAEINQQRSGARNAKQKINA